MKIRFFIFLVIAGLIVSTAPSQTIATTDTDNKVHKISFTEFTEMTTNHPQKLKKYKQLLNKPGYAVVIYGAPVDREMIFNQLLKDKKAPYLFAEGEIDRKTKKKHKAAEYALKSSKDKMNTTNKETPYNPFIKKDKSKQYTTSLTIYNYQGKIFIQNENYYLPEGMKLSKTITREEIRKKVMSEKGNKQIASFKKSVQNHEMEKKFHTDEISGGSAQLEGSVTDYAHVYGVDKGGEEFLVGIHTTDYLIYNANDSDTDYDHIIIWTEVQAEPINVVNPAVDAHTSGYQGDIATMYYSDTLIDWDPSTSSLEVDKGDSVGNFTIGYPATVSWGFNWDGENGAELVTKADKTPDVGQYTNFWRDSFSKIYPVATNKFDNEYAVMLRVDTLGGSLSEVEAQTAQSFSTYWPAYGDSTWGGVIWELYFNY